ncbi:MAG: AAA family ATPase, partial [Eubacteriales bacterium]|nr:AAA family ATPase [Eubacteriales bacterium]
VEWCRSIGRKDDDIFKCLSVARDGAPEFVPSEDSPKLDSARLPLPCTVAEIDFNTVRRYRFIINTILPEGVTFLNGYAKTGKSRLILQMCLAVCWGVPFLGYATTKSDVLYCALEDEMADFAPRLEMMLQGQPAPKNFYYYTKEAFDNKPPRLGEKGGLAQLISQAIEAHPGISLVCVDVFGGIRSEKERFMDFTDYERKDLDELIKLAADFQIALVIAHHVGKNGEKSMAVGNDFMGSGAGSFTIPATVHSVWYLARDRDDEKRMMLAYRGRRIKSGSLAMRDEYPRFNLEGDWEAITFAEDPAVATIKYLVREFGQWRGTAKQLVEVNQENEDLPPIIKKPNKNTIEKFARQLQSIGIRYIQHSNGNASPTHEFIRADMDDNKFTEMPDYEGLEWEEVVKEE